MSDREEELERLTSKGVETDRRVYYCMDDLGRRDLEALMTASFAGWLNTGICKLQVSVRIVKFKG